MTKDSVVCAWGSCQFISLHALGQCLHDHDMWDAQWLVKTTTSAGSAWPREDGEHGCFSHNWHVSLLALVFMKANNCLKNFFLWSNWLSVFKWSSFPLEIVEKHRLYLSTDSAPCSTPTKPYHGLCKPSRSSGTHQKQGKYCFIWTVISVSENKREPTKQSLSS